MKQSPVVLVEVFGNPEDFLDYEDGITVVSYEKIYDAVDSKHKDYMFGLALLVQSSEYAESRNDIETISEIILFFLDVNFLLLEEGVPEDLISLTDTFLSSVSTNALFLSLSKLNDYFDTLEYDALNTENGEVKFLENFFALYGVCNEITNREGLVALKSFDFIYKYYSNVREGINSIQEKGGVAILNLNIILEEVRKEFILKK